MTWNGSTDLILTSRERSYDPTSGFRTTEIYEGTFEAVAAQEAALSNGGYLYRAEYGPGSPVARLTISTPDAGESPTQTEGVIATNFSLDQNFGQRSWKEHPDVLKLSTAIKTRLFSDVLKFTRWNGDGTEPTANAIVTGNTVANNWYTSAKLGQDSFYSGQWIFRISQVITSHAVSTILQSGTGRRYTHAQLIAETNPRAPWGDNAAGTGQIQKAEANVLVDVYQNSIPTGHTIGWLKHSFKSEPVSGNRAIATVEYWLDAWADHFYPAR